MSIKDIEVSKKSDDIEKHDSRVDNVAVKISDRHSITETFWKKNIEL